MRCRDRQRNKSLVASFLNIRDPFWNNFYVQFGYIRSDQTHIAFLKISKFVFPPIAIRYLLTFFPCYSYLETTIKSQWNTSDPLTPHYLTPTKKTLEAKKAYVTYFARLLSNLCQQAINNFVMWHDDIFKQNCVFLSPHHKLIRMKSKIMTMSFPIKFVFM